MEYRYNYAFLPSWIKKNKLKATDVLGTLGTKDYSTLRKWMSGERIIRVDAMIRLCNTFGIPIESFFVNMEDTQKDFVVPEYESMDEIVKPKIDNDPDKNAYGVSPEVLEKRLSILPKRWSKLYSKRIKEVMEGQLSNEDILKFNMESLYNKNINKLSDKYKKQEENLKAEFKMERDELMAQLSDKDETISKLSETLLNMTKNINQTNGIINNLSNDNMVSDELKK